MPGTLSEGTLGQVTVTATHQENFLNWNDCFNIISYPSNQSFAFALGYLYDDAVFWDLNSNLLRLSREDCEKKMRQISSMFDNIPFGAKDAGSILRGYNYSSPNTAYSPPAQGLDGSYWGAFKAAAHWLWGNKAPVSLDIKELRLQLTIDRIGATSLPLTTVIANSRQPGTYQYDSGPYGYETYSDEVLPPKLLVGGIVLRTTGTLTRNSEGSYNFSGFTSAYPDTFNMDKRPGRPWWADKVVETFNAIGGQDYTINITGQIPTNFQGN